MPANNKIIGTALAATVAATATADITGIVVDSYTASAADFDGSSTLVNVQDMYAMSNDAADVLLNVFNMRMGFSGNTATFFQSFTGTGWQPTNLGGPFDVAALQQTDSFVTIGGFAADALQTPGAGAGTGLDPNFGGNTAVRPGALAGWYNGSPPSLNGAMIDGKVLVGRFSSADGEFSLAGSTLSATWNQGLGTPPGQGSFTIAEVPAPGALALLGIAGLAGRRRRG